MNTWGLTLTLVILAAAVLPVVLCFASLRWRLTAVMFFVGIALVVVNLRSPQAADISKLSDLAKPVVASDQEFITSDTCRACHPGEHASWHATYHRTMTQMATPESVQAPFDNVQLELDGRQFRLWREGDEFWVEMPDPDQEAYLVAEGVDLSQATDVPTVRRQVLMTTGSHHLQDYWVASHEGRGLYHVPWEYHIDEQRWIPFTDAHVAPPEERRGVSHWNSSCIVCHSVNGVPGWNPETGFWSTRVAELGIACEACHGPAQAHVAHHRNPLNRLQQYRSDQPDPTIVNPARCSPKVSTSICGRCHATFHVTDSAGLPDMPGYLMNGDRYRAGQDLANSVRMLGTHKPGKNFKSEFRNLYWNENDARDAFWRDGTARVGGREYLGLLESPCFQQGEMSCLSCHSMHNSNPSGQVAHLMDGDTACTQCHQSIGNDIAAHTHHPLSSTGSRCYNCHMPRTSYALLRTARSHRIDSPNIASSISSGRPNACNLCHLDQTLSWSAQHLSDWFGTKKPPMTAAQQETAASLLWLLKGDAAQRAVTAWHMGWPPAQAASGSKGWPAPFLSVLLEDPYSAVRFTAFKALTAIPGYADFAFDFVGSPQQRASAKQHALDIWKREYADQFDQPHAQLLLQPGGHIDQQRFETLLQQRDDRPIRIKE